eukprot:NODE_11312_length_1295_cov_4.927226.p1 GENE.NODE_11312_length_1295_cov_4.927226~~NODE_11312_length_1295_cov_4.927226.p1  ORF type:complete len:341 (+),score=118.10 NODE_11312_length_1295_cov_4.927226:78-1025(+)
MVPSDDQLIPYGQDTSISVSRSQPKALQEDKIVSVTVSSGAPWTITLCHRNVAVTRYVVKNNSQRTVPRFYIDHTASARHGGYHVVTKERSVKAVTGFSRYAFRLTPSGEVKFDVLEEAEFVEVVQGSSVQDFLPTRGKQLLADGILDAAAHANLEQVTRNIKLRRHYARCENVSSQKDSELQGLLENLPQDSELRPLLEQTLDARKKKLEIGRNEAQAQARQKHVFSDQDRIRQNLRSMEKIGTSGNTLCSRYLADLNTAEDELKGMRRQLELLNEQAAELEDQRALLETRLSTLGKQLREKLDLEESAAGRRD